MDMAILREVLGWCTALNLGLLVFGGLVVMGLGGAIRPLHARLYDVPEGDLSGIYFQYLAQYKIAIFVFNLIPYVALRIVE